MAFDSKGLDDYIDVAQRIVEFRAKYPEGSLQPANPAQPFDIRQITGTDKNGKEQSGTFIIYTAAAYRNPDDPRPGIGCAYEVFPGRTPYTAGSELQNAETAAWGRAIVAALAADTRAGIASQQEVRNRQAEHGQSAADAFENATPAPPRQSGNGRQRGQESRPPGETTPYPSTADAVEVGAIDEDAQTFADRAHKALVPAEIETIHREAREAGLVAKRIRNPASGGVGKLAVYLDWKRKQLMAAKPAGLDPDDPWAAKVEEIPEGDDAAAAAVLEEAALMLGKDELDADHYGLIVAAIEEKFPKTAADRQAA